MKVVLLLTLLPLLLTAQTDCDCPATFAWVKKTFEENDAGFAYAVDRKGQQAYEATTKKTQAAVDTVSEANGCTQAIYGWLTWFRPGHVSISQVQQQNTQEDAPPATAEEIRSRYANWKRVDVPVSEFEASLESDDPYEGIWVTGDYRIGIKKMDDRYVGAILRADSLYWMPGQIKLEFDLDTMLTYYMQDHSPRYVHAPTPVGTNYLVADWVTLQRETPRGEDDPMLDLYLRASETEVPLFERIDDRTVYLRIPSFDQHKKVEIDSVIAAHREEILRTETLILDIHSGTGGSDQSFAELLPILYTNPIYTTNTEFYSTPANNQRMLDFADDPTAYGIDEETTAWALRGYDTLSQHLGEFVNLDGGRQDTLTFDTIHPYPARVAILIDGGNGSTDEEFLLAAKQSQKVKLFGQSTFGVLDISNMYFVPSPCGDYQLGYSLTRSLRIPDFTIDGVGIQPDFFIDRAVPKWHWVNYVLGVW